MKRTINVTAAHIKAGKVCDPTRCPVSLAIREALDYPVVSVGTETVKVGHRTHYLPGNAHDFIGEFDFGNHVEPFSFELEMR